MPWPFYTEEELQRLEADRVFLEATQEPSEFTTETGVRIETTRTPLYDRSRTVLAYRTYQRGEGVSPLLLIHDLQQPGGEVFKRLACTLAERQHIVYVPMMRGFGTGIWYSQSISQPGKHVSLGDHLQDLEVGIQGQGLTPEHLTIMGLGVGGILAQLYAERHAIARLALLNSCSVHRAVAQWRNSPSRNDFRKLRARGRLPLHTEKVLVMVARDYWSLNPANIYATAQDYGVQAILLPEKTEPSFWDEVATHLSWFATALLN